MHNFSNTAISPLPAKLIDLQANVIWRLSKELVLFWYSVGQNMICYSDIEHIRIKWYIEWKIIPCTSYNHIQGPKVVVSRSFEGFSYNTTAILVENVEEIENMSPKSSMDQYLQHLAVKPDIIALIYLINLFQGHLKVVMYCKFYGFSELLHQRKRGNQIWLMLCSGTALKSSGSQYSASILKIVNSRTSEGHGYHLYVCVHIEHDDIWHYTMILDTCDMFWQLRFPI